MRLVNGKTSNEGVVEMCKEGIWNQICDEDWSSNDAEVVCRQLGYTSFCKLTLSLQNRTGLLHTNFLECTM